MGVRKNQAALTASEKRDFVDAVLALKRSGRYDAFVRTHNAFIMSDTDDSARAAHRCPSFLPWHRKFLLDFERELQAINPAVNLPYWDWTVDNSPSSSLWRDDFLGGDGQGRERRVTTGPFASGNGWELGVVTDSRTFLSRSLGGGGRLPLPTRGEVDSVLRMSAYDAAPWNSGASGFRNNLEGWRGVNLHNRVHVWVGGHMAQGVSPNDPVFWLHHCFVDKLWVEWQERHGRTYLPTTRTPRVVSIGETMRPWNDTTPRDMLDHRPFYTYDAPGSGR
ncbi:tyrosinase family protein [Streptomyces sp. ODS28]|uniref:tyrosinase MelC2 n=1 Tax=Streptomyces sp. ODS28 TaxID=3136688 RepID=UPI0031E6A9E6